MGRLCRPAEEAPKGSFTGSRTLRLPPPHPAWSGIVAVALATLLAVGCCSLSRGSSGVAPGSDGAGVAPIASERAVADAPAPQAAPRTASTPGVPANRALPSAVEPRQIIRSGTADLEVRSVVDAFEAVRRIAAAAGGTVADSTYTGAGKEQSARLTLRVPARFDDVVARLREVALEVRSITTGSRDVTEEYTDVEATLRSLRAVEAQYMQLLGRASSIADTSCRCRTA